MTESLFIALILFAATVVASTFGFGGALLAMPLLTQLVGLSIATPLCGLISPTVSSLMLLQNWGQVEWRSARWLVFSTLMGIPLGIELVKLVPETTMVPILGTVLVFVGGYRLVRWQWLMLRSPLWAIPFGFVAGILGGAYNTNGPPVVIYGECRRWSPQAFSATLQSYFFPTGIFILIGHGLSGLWTPDIFRLYAMSLPGVVVAIAMGNQLNRQFSRDRFETWISGLLIALGLLLWV
jgi:uncharacterized membrane protein YfcA